MAKTIKNFIVSFVTAFFTKWLEDFFIFVGVAVIVINTYLITTVDVNIIAGNYLLGLILIILGVVLAKQ
ncbi:hypothetical protein H9655_08880 [Cytobacillus sp. Sa5YUA1]|uniref:Uncharacterized protein n=1 Tax=Cytobacillus stercorigallinarum TaxID=2762240 RepID=A0ABR8QNM2_9BACI|nr:hypothetical protein [Cytobacillus stercorigallinarum]MBD7937144.1 hypothetical protein [Cytobacillus stercorigallinarum]